jgi:predicted porin
MKLQKVILVAAAAGCSLSALAQSSVILYGSVDAGIGYNSNIGGHSQWQAQNANSQPDRFGLKGVEDLGGGLRTLFTLEAGYSTITGASNKAGSIFNREASVALDSSTFGTLTIGHMAGLAYAYLNPLDAAVLGYTYQAYHPGNLDELTSNSLSQLDNVIRYQTPIYAGFQAATQIGLSNSTDFAAGRSYGFGLRYNQGALRAATEYSVETNHQMNAVSQIGFASFQGVSSSAVYIADKVTNFGASVNYKLGSFTLHSMYTNVKLQRAGFSDTFQELEAGTAYWTSGANQIDGTAYSARLAGVKWNQFGLNDIYFLSKATQVYAGVTLQRATPGGEAVIYSNLPSSTTSQIAVRFGMHHSF